ncbi:pyridoxamine 5'-phosphate oxidase [Pelagicoccus sp. NFK12]|uniref:Pyridoxamine 5'-phosphate oxidase n=1 Tax=Pelagicoccus enzymogenes TaxID=2773457 RepID=A0A927IDL4_9BACT|nr:pyridoxamine 5'-phosphate oxidase [Pelagicoccus enzymogenes]MBD5778107.1 pyridoxamine 5'-phosphate oxidase [Pelagicoccus enzymogenes]MDQ8198137.1 pyridoxamine 5'-phosphate oxidase [Pelagicoccus enzymogenes]
MADLGDLREEYGHDSLSEDSVHPNPVEQFRIWFDHAVDKKIPEPNAMSLATVDETGQPWQRTVLLKAYDDKGFVFYTNYESRKGKQLAHNPKTCVLFPWIQLERQVIVTGSVERVSTSESLKYFASRPFGSRLGAWVSQQSSVVSSRSILLAKFEEMKNKFKDGDVPLPSFWGGYRIVPDTIEFWLGGKSRIHDRIFYRKASDGSWTIERLAP